MQLRVCEDTRDGEFRASPARAEVQGDTGSADPLFGHWETLLDAVKSSYQFFINIDIPDKQPCLVVSVISLVSMVLNPIDYFFSA